MQSTLLFEETEKSATCEIVWQINPGVRRARAVEDFRLGGSHPRMRTANINDPMTHGMNWAILTLGVVVGTVVATFIGYFIYIVRKGERLEAAAQQKSVPGLSAAAA